MKLKELIYQNNYKMEELKLTPSEWLNEIAIILKEEIGYKDYTIEQILEHFDTEESIENGYNYGLTPREFVEENFFE